MIIGDDLDAGEVPDDRDRDDHERNEDDPRAGSVGVDLDGHAGPQWFTRRLGPATLFRTAMAGWNIRELLSTSFRVPVGGVRDDVPSLIRRRGAEQPCERVEVGGGDV